MSHEPGPTPYLLPTPAGAFGAAAEPDRDPLRRFMAALLQRPVTPSVAEQDFLQWSGFERLDEANDWVWRMQELGWLQGLAAPRRAPEGSFERVLVELLPSLTRGGKVLLADSHGFQISTQGFTHEVAEEISALSADIAALHQRRSGSLNRNLGLSGSAWGLLDAAGQSQLGFWPLYAGKERFVLVIAGMPSFNCPQLVDLVWVLQQRYAVGQSS
jgi:hypothetical protein